MIVSTWEPRELPILQAIARAEAGNRSVDLSSIADESGIDRPTVERGVEALSDGRYLTGNDTTTFDGYDLIAIRLLERGRRAVGSGPQTIRWRA